MSRTLPRYPIYVISKGRSDCCLTARFLMKEGVDFRLIVEPQEVALYEGEFGRDRILVLPFANLGQGSIPARNWVMEHSIAAGAARHWILDDNIEGIWRRWQARKVRCQSGVAFRIIEDFADRYENVAIAGMNYYMFSLNKKLEPPFRLNVHLYSCILIDNSIPYRWRGRYNEDTDLCLQVLAGGLCTVQFNAFLCWKMSTMTMKGGNTAELYQGDGRLRMARSLERVWPGVVSTRRRFQRPQHVIKDGWGKFDTPLKRKASVDFDALPTVDNYGLEIVQKKETKSPEFKALIDQELAARAIEKK